jgi:hypothetical protein
MGPASERHKRETQALVDAVVGTRAGAPAEPMGLYLFAASDPGGSLGTEVEEAVFFETFGNTPELLAKEYEPYASSSVLLVVVDHLRRMPAGVLRILVPSAAGFKTFNDVGPLWGVDVDEMLAHTGIALDRSATWDVATLAVGPQYRGKAATGLVTLALFQGLTMLGWRFGIEWFVALLDMPVYRLIRWKLHMTFAGFAGVPALPYLGSPASLPVWCRIPDGKARLAERDCDLHDLLFHGIGMEAAVRPLDLASALERVARISDAARGGETGSDGPRQSGAA